MDKKILRYIGIAAMTFAVTFALNGWSRLHAAQPLDTHVSRSAPTQKCVETLFERIAGTNTR